MNISDAFYQTMRYQMREVAECARQAAASLSRARPDAKNYFLKKLASLLMSCKNDILAENLKDVEAAKTSGMDAPRLDRLTLTPAIIEEMCAGCMHIAALPDPVGATETQWQRPNGILVGKMRIPLGVIAMIYEARPNVTIDAAALCIKAGNAVILRGGKEAVNSNIILAGLLQKALHAAELPIYAAQLVTIPNHEAVTALCKMDELIDVIIPRGGENLIKAVCEAATVPVLKHYMGVCHCYVDKEANMEEACAIIDNSKLQRPGVCNALECLLVHKDIAGDFLPLLSQKLMSKKIEFRACPQSLPLLSPKALPISPGDLGCEFHAPVLAVVVVDSMDAAINHIAKYSSNHTDVICTENYNNAMRFLREVDSSMVGVNVSTRFNDGGQLGLGAEIGISTSKLHAYGPMGVKELTTTKFVVLGNGQIRR